jgi:hypothetical protein
MSNLDRKLRVFASNNHPASKLHYKIIKAYEDHYKIKANVDDRYNKSNKNIIHELYLKPKREDVLTAHIPHIGFQHNNADAIKVSAYTGKPPNHTSGLSGRINKDSLKELKNFFKAHDIDYKKHRTVTASYQEEPNSTFEDEGVKYNLNSIFKSTEVSTPIHLPISKLMWQVSKKEIGTSKQNLAKDPNKIDLSVPIIVWRKDAKHVVLVDGMHRLKKAINQGVKELPAKWVTRTAMDEAKVKPKHSIAATLVTAAFEDDFAARNPDT